MNASLPNKTLSLIISSELLLLHMMTFDRKLQVQVEHFGKVEQ